MNHRHKYGIGIECEFTPLIDITEYKDQLGYGELPFLFMTPFDLMYTYNKIKTMTEEELNKSILDYDDRFSALNDKQKFIEYIKKNYNTYAQKHNHLIDKLEELKKKDHDPIVLRDIYIIINDLSNQSLAFDFKKTMGPNFNFSTKYFLTMRNITKIDYIYTNGINGEIEHFSGINGFEVKNSNSRNHLKHQVKEIIDNINDVINKFESTFPFYKNKYIIHNGYMANIYSPKLNAIVNSYTGSYHINLTFPVEINKNILNFENKHVNFMRAIRLIEPLLLACCTSVGYNIFGDKHKYPENSARLLFGGYFNFMALYPLDISLYDNEAPHILKGDTRKFSISTFKKKIEKKLQNIYPEIKNLDGSDFRINSEYYVPKEDKYFGFEFRFFDFINIEDFKTMVQFIIMLCDYVEINNISIDNISFEEDDYVDMIIDILKEGWNVIVPDIYIKLLNNVFKFNLDGGNYYDTLNSIYHIVLSLTTNNRKAIFRNTMISSDIYKKNIPNPNKRLYEKMLELQIPDIKKRLQNIRSRVTDDSFESFKAEAIKEFPNYDIEEDLVDIYNFITN